MLNFQCRKMQRLSFLFPLNKSRVSTLIVLKTRHNTSHVIVVGSLQLIIVGKFGFVFLGGGGL